MLQSKDGEVVRLGRGGESWKALEVMGSMNILSLVLGAQLPIFCADHQKSASSPTEDGPAFLIWKISAISSLLRDDMRN